MKHGYDFPSWTIAESPTETYLWQGVAIPSEDFTLFDVCNVEEVFKLQTEIKKLKEELELAHAHIHNLQDAYNECRNWFSSVEFESETEELDELISLDNCDEREAVNLKNETESFAIGWFRYWYSDIKDRYQIKSLDEYIAWSDKNLDILSQRIKAREVLKEIG